MSVKFGLMGILAKRPLHGYELKRVFDRLTGGFWQLNHGQIYQTLERLEDEGFVTHTVQREESVPDRKVYSLTPVGQEAFRSWIESVPEPRPRPLRDELFIRLAVMPDGDPAQALELLAAHRSVYLEQMRELTRARTDLEEAGGVEDTLVEELLLDAALFHTEADLRWLDHCEARLRSRARADAN